MDRGGKRRRERRTEVLQREADPDRGWRSVTEIVDTWRDLPVQPWEKKGEPPPWGGKKEQR
jgi:hypothetical protein